ncbi:hypothetical protein VC83_04774 [Pseudogymnoascus destructans]|uniref:Uncharacterized protein n=1 Tax=Pseudogymnoascus destructans TaxID=655981 RepID=A0A177A5C7_9PEZI|nr:uncharacterized protein VC83_04774 [Pseudogymnoascus destructans]OAF57376.1 hypothetical protein VC83_04774 [Pseudogymnoascus destructans]
MKYLEASLPDLQRPDDISNDVVYLSACYEEKLNGKSKAIELLRSTLGRPEISSAPMDQAIRLEARFRCRISSLLCGVSPPQPIEAQDEVVKAAELLGRFEIVGHPYEKLIPYMITRCRGKIALVHAANSDSKEADELLRESEIEVLEYCSRLKDIKTPSNAYNNRKIGLLSLLGQVYMAQAARGQPKVKKHYNFCRHYSGDLSTWALRALHELAECLREKGRYHDMEVLLKVLTSNSDIAEHQGYRSFELGANGTGKVARRNGYL